MTPAVPSARPPAAARRLRLAEGPERPARPGVPGGHVPVGALSLFLGRFGRNATRLLPTRPAAMALGAALSLAAVWWPLSVNGRTGGRTVHPRHATRAAERAR